MKKCTKCKEEKSLEEFQSEKRKTDGKSSRCKQCLNKDKKEYLDTKREEIRKYNRKKYYENHEINREKRTEYSRNLRNTDTDSISAYKKKWWKKHAKRLREEQNERRKTEEFREYRRNYQKNRLSQIESFKSGARKIFQMAVKFKHLIRPDVCSKCNKNCRPHGHHEDYSKPLEVTWLCKICHNHAHGKLLDVKP